MMRLLRIIFSFVLYFCVFAQLSFASEIILTSPLPNVVTAKKNILFQGSAVDASVLKINGEVISLDAKGAFYHEVILDPNVLTQVFNLSALNKDFSMSTLKRQVSYKKSSTQKSVSVSKDLDFTLYSPVNHQVSHKNLILVKGVASNASAVFVNNKEVKMSASGRFYQKVSLDKPNTYHTVSVRAVAGDNKAVEKAYKVYYLDPDSQLTGKDALFKAIEAISLVPTADPVDKTEVIHSVVKRVKMQDEKETVPIVPTQKNAVIVVTYPPDNLVTYESKVILKGYVENSQEFYINNRIVRVNDMGQFSEEFELAELGRYVFNLYAAGEAAEGRTILRKVYRAEQDKSEVVQDTSSSESIDKRLSKRIGALNLSGTDIKDVMNILADMGELNIVSDQSLAGIVTISLKDVTIQHALDLILNAQGLSYKIIDNTIMVASEENLNKVTRIETRVIRLNNAKASEMVTLLKGRLSGKESVEFSKQENMLVLSADSKKINTMMTLIAKLDSQKIPQILLEAQFLEITQTSLKSLGVSWGNAFSLGFTSTISDGQGSSTLGLSLQTLLNTLQSEGKARLLAKPTIKAIDGQEAEIFIGDNIPYVEIASDPSGRVVESVKYIESGILLKILPEINTITQEIRIEFKPEVSFVNGFGGPNGDIPIVRSRRVDTTVFVQNGKTVLIGGLFNSSDSDNSSRMPVLSRVPILGYFFKTKRDLTEETELVIALTPRIIDPMVDEVVKLGTN